MPESYTKLRSSLTHPDENPIKRWLLLTGDRLTVTFVLMLVVYALLLVLALAQPAGTADLLNETNAAKRLFSSLLSGAILLVSIVVSINSVSLSQEITDLKNQQQRIDASLEYHREIEEFIDDDITPARPAEFMNAVLYAISCQTRALVQLSEDSDHEEYENRIEELADEIAEEIVQARETLSSARIGTFKVLLAGLNYDYSGQLHATRGINRRYGNQVDEDVLDGVNDLIDTLKHIGTAQEYFKSLYYKRELAHLSSHLLFVSLPVIVFTSYILLALDANLIPSLAVFNVPPNLLAIAFIYIVALAPYIVLTSYIMRTATITLRTLAAGPFILQEGSDIDAFSWEVFETDRDWELTERASDD